MFFLRTAIKWQDKLFVRHSLKHSFTFLSFYYVTLTVSLYPECIHCDVFLFHCHLDFLSLTIWKQKVWRKDFEMLSFSSCIVYSTRWFDILCCLQSIASEGMCVKEERPSWDLLANSQNQECSLIPEIEEGPQASLRNFHQKHQASYSWIGPPA